jgi:nicotinate-nucleotide pyrophosphorylase (carboxylating)
VTDFHQWIWNAELEEDCRHLVRLSLREDLARWHDWTTVSLVPREAKAAADFVVRKSGAIAGLAAFPAAIEELNVPLEWSAAVTDGSLVSPGTRLGTLWGSARDLLTVERTLLNLLGHLSGIATLTRRYVELIAGTQAKIYDTRKTLPGWRRLEKYAVHCGGGRNHRSGLYDALLIKDNHLALGRQVLGGQGFTPGEAVDRAREFIRQQRAEDVKPGMIVEVEVDSLTQLRDVLPHHPDIVLLDNMTPTQLREGVAMRKELAPQVELEASGGVNLETVRAIAETGVDRISVGALTHSAVGLDIGLDWVEG